VLKKSKPLTEVLDGIDTGTELNLEGEKMAFEKGNKVEIEGISDGKEVIEGIATLVEATGNGRWLVHFDGDDKADRFTRDEARMTLQRGL